MLTFVLLIVASAGFSCLAIGVRRIYDEEVPPLVALGLLGLILTVEAPLAIAPSLGLDFGVHAGSLEVSPIVLVPAAALVSVVPIVLIAGNVANVFSNMVVGGVFDSSLLEPAPSDFSKARAQWKQGNVTAALNEYWKAFEENPKRPAALFAAASMLEFERRPQDAAKLYYDIGRRFEKAPVVWAEAALRRGRLEVNVLKHPEEARRLFVEIHRRARGSAQARSALAELQRLPGPQD